MQTAWHSGVHPFFDAARLTDDFNKPKIVWADIGGKGNAFIYDDNGFTVSNTTYLIASDDTSMLKYLICLLNSKTILRYLDWIGVKLGDAGWRWFKQYVELFPIPVIPTERRGFFKVFCGTRRGMAHENAHSSIRLASVCINAANCGANSRCGFGLNVFVVWCIIAGNSSINDSRSRQ